MRRFLLTAIFSLFIVTTGVAQPDRLAVIVKGGISFYAGLYGSAAGLGSRFPWKAGPAIGVGIEYSMSRSLVFQGVVEYSTHAYPKHEWGHAIQNDPHNSFIELDLNAKLGFGLFYGLAGISLYHQNVDPVQVFVLNELASGTAAESKTRLGSTIGIGLLIPVSPAVAFFAEGSLRMRQYVTPVLQLGVKIGI